MRRWLLSIGGAVAVTFVAMLVLLPGDATVTVVRPPPISEPAIPGLPVRLTIPSISVDAAIEYVGVAPDGTMGVPKSPERVGWFQFGPRPGEAGSAVMDGHFGWKDRTPAVFDVLGSLQKGDRLYVEDDTGATTVFIVQGSRLYDPNGEANEVFNSSDGKAHLNLVTCEGVWDPFSKSYAKRLVVFADKV